MCTQNYWVDIVETSNGDSYYNDSWWIEYREKQKRRVGLKGDVPEWLLWRMTGNPPSRYRRMCRRDVRNQLNHRLRNAFASGSDFEDFVIEDRVSRIDRRTDWF